MTQEEAEQKEIELIARYNTTDRRYGYNVHKGGDIKAVGGDNFNAIKIICINTGEVFDCITDATLKYNISRRCIYSCLKSDQHTAGVYNGERLTWQYYDEYLIEPREKYTECRFIPTKKRVLCVETGIIYDSPMDASNNIGINNKYISRNCRGEKKSACGYHFEYID